MAKTSGIEYANIAAVKCVESAANTLTFKKFDTQTSVMSKIAWLINRIDIFIDVSATQWNANLDSVSMALTRSNLMTSLIDLTEGAILWNAFIQRTDIGTSATSWFLREPFVYDFSTLPGGGLLTPPTPLYAAVAGVSCTAANTMYMRLYYQPIEMQGEEFWQLVESVRIIGS